MRRGAPLSQVSQDARGPLCRSRTTSYRWRRRLPAELDVVADPLPAPGARGQDDLVQAGVVPHDRGRRRLDEVGQMRIRPGATQRPDDRRGEDHVADQAQTHDQHAHGRDYSNAERRMLDAEAKG